MRSCFYAVLLICVSTLFSLLCSRSNFFSFNDFCSTWKLVLSFFKCFNHKFVLSGAEKKRHPSHFFARSSVRPLLRQMIIVAKQGRFAKFRAFSEVACVFYKNTTSLPLCQAALPDSCRTK